MNGRGRKGEGWTRGEIFRRGRKRKRVIGDRKRGMRPSEVLNYVNPRWIGKILDYFVGWMDHEKIGCESMKR
jgi:hypothetical protein